MMSSRDKRRVAISGGLLAGVGLGSLLAWLLDIFEIAHPVLPQVLPGLLRGYPDMALTAFVVIVFSSAFGAGLGLVASALIREEDVRQVGAATVADPSDAASSQKTKPSARTIMGFVRGS
jgi:hypothetical protein